MKGFIGINIPLNVRRIVTMLPALIIIAMGINPMKALILSQVALSFALPLAIIPMLLITRRRDTMGVFVNRRAENITGWIIAALIIGLNVVLIALTFTGKV
jgi:manganese transport protein